MFPILFSFGPFTLHTYGLMVAIGFLCALAVARKQFERFNLPADQLDRVVLFIMIAGLLGARTLYFALENFELLQADPLSFFRIWEGGLVFYGGVIGGLVTLAVYARLHHLPFLSMTDAFSAPLLLGHAFGRVGCFAAGCCYGKPSDLPWAVVFEHPASLAPRFASLHPTQLYESAGNLLLFFAALALSRRRLGAGMLSAFYAVSYGSFRFAMEFLRNDDRGGTYFGGSPSQVVAVLLVICGIGLFVHAKKENAQ